MAPCPSQYGEIRDRRLVGKELLRGESAVHHAIQPPGLFRVTVECITAVLVPFDRHEMVDLSGDRPKSPLLEHQPLENRNARFQAPRPELACLLAQIDQDRTGLEDAYGLSVGSVQIDDRRDLGVRTDFQEFRLELVTFANIDNSDDVRERHFLQGDTDLAAVGRVERVQFYWHWASRSILSIEFASRIKCGAVAIGNVASRVDLISAR